MDPRKRKVTVAQRSDGYTVTSLQNTTEWDIGQVLTKREVEEIINHRKILVVVNGPK